jgi:undecaprenyl-diphosphatase
MASQPIHPQGKQQAKEGAADSTYVQRVLRRLRYSWRIWLIGLMLVGGCTSLFMEVAGDVAAGESFPWDAPIMLAVYEIHHPWLDIVMIGITRIGYLGVFVLGASSIFWYWRQRHIVAAIALSVSITGSIALNSWLKLLYARPRPEIFPPLTSLTSYSFPSGHAMGAMGFYGFAAYLLWQQGQRLWALLALLFSLLVGFTRIYLGVHYPSDIVGALAVGAVWLTVVIAGYRYYYGRYTAGHRQAEPLSSSSELGQQEG